MKLWYTTEGRRPKKTIRKEAKRKPCSVSDVQDVNNHQEPRFDQGPWRQSAPSALILELHSMWKQMVSCNPSFSYNRSESNKVWVHPRAVAAFICELCLSETRVAPLAQRTALGIPVPSFIEPGIRAYGRRSGLSAVALGVGPDSTIHANEGIMGKIVVPF